MSVQWSVGGESKRGPSWRELVDQAARLLGFQNPEFLRIRGTDLQILEYFKLQKGHFAPLTNWLYSHMNPPREALEKSPIHRELVELRSCRLFYTTNYDNFIERCFEIHGRTCKVVAVEGEMGRSTDEGEVVKFHGDWDHPDHMVLSESEFESRLKLSTAMDYRLRADLLGRVLLFLGYSFRDYNVSYLFRRFNEDFQGVAQSLSGRRAYITVPDPSNFEKQLFAERNIEVIPLNGDNQTTEIAMLLQEMRA